MKNFKLTIKVPCFKVYTYHIEAEDKSEVLDKVCEGLNGKKEYVIESNENKNAKTLLHIVEIIK